MRSTRRQQKFFSEVVPVFRASSLRRLVIKDPLKKKKIRRRPGDHGRQLSFEQDPVSDD